jgi:hypothetical protein
VVAHHLAKVRVAGSNPVFRSQVPCCVTKAPAAQAQRNRKASGKCALTCRCQSRARSRSSSGQDASLSRRWQGFNSPTGYVAREHKCITPVVYSAWYSWYCPTCGQEWMYGDNSRRWGMPNVPHTPWDEAAERVDGPPWKPEPTPHESNTSMMFTHLRYCRSKGCLLCISYNQQLLEGGAPDDEAACGVTVR